MLLLASKSPRRQSLLQQIGISYSLIDIEIDESPFVHEDPFHYVERMASSKANAAKIERPCTTLPILTADTIVTKNGIILGKPTDYENFVEMMHSLSGSSHQVFSAIALTTQDTSVVKTSIGTVTFAALPEQFIKAYWATGEPCDKAGGYAVQGIMARYIQNINGSYSGIMGLPLFELSEALREIKYNSGSFITE